VPYLRAKVRKPNTITEELFLSVAKAIKSGTVADSSNNYSLISIANTTVKT
jgi:hypothetical protein